jgi:hypothetical protein
MMDDELNTNRMSANRGIELQLRHGGLKSKKSEPKKEKKKILGVDLKNSVTLFGKTLTLHIDFSIL